MMKILVVGALPRSLLNFRGPLLRAMVANGHAVSATANGADAEGAAELAAMGVEYFPVKINRNGQNPFADCYTCIQLLRLIRRIQPDIVVSYTVKPVIFGGIAARLCRIHKIYSLITGLGHTFIEASGLYHQLLSEMVKRLYRLSLHFSEKVFFQNPDDIDDFVITKIITRNKAVLINGTGVDLAYYAPTILPKEPVFLLVGRLLVEKGIREYVAAAKLLKMDYPEVRCLLAGALDSNPSSISQEELTQWQQEGCVEYLGYHPDIRPILARASVFVLPSYREGTPRTVLEAMAMGRPVVVSNAPGCRETVRLQEGVTLDKKVQDVIQGENGFLVPVKNVEKLAWAMEQFIVNPALRDTMGAASKLFVTEKYDVNKVNAVLLREMELG